MSRTPREFADRIARLLNVDPTASWNQENFAAVISEIGDAKQEWNQRCNAACKKQVHKQVNEAYEQAARIAELESFIAAKQIRALKIPL